MEKLVFRCNYFNFEALCFAGADFFCEVERRVNLFREVDCFRGYSVVAGGVATAG